MSDLLGTIITALLGGGGLAFVAALVRGWRTVRAGARALEREAVADLARWRDENDKARRREAIDRAYWERIAGGYAYQLRALGAEPNPPNPVSPSEQSREA